MTNEQNKGMKKYVVRSIGWVFDDDWYNYDGEHDIIGVFDQEADAIHRVDKLNHRYFLVRIFSHRPFQLTYNDAPNKELFLDQNLLAELIAKEMGIAKNEIYDADRGFIWKDQVAYLKKLGTHQVKTILAGVGISFFTYLELPATEFYLLKFKRNPVIWERFLDKDIYTDSNEYYYFFDHRDSDFHRLVASRREAYYYAMNQSYDVITWTLTQKDMLVGELDFLSETPNLLEQIIRNASSMVYDTENKKIIINKTITPNELMSLDSVLKTPILLFEKIHMDSIETYEVDNDYYVKEVKELYGW